MTIEQARNIIYHCAKLYDTNLCNKQIMFVYKNANNTTDFVEVRFRSHNFLHFTGVKARKELSANHFYKLALNHKLSTNDFSFNSNHTTELKLYVLPYIMRLDNSARMTGNYIGPHLELYTEKVTGTTTACLGLIHIKDFYIPNSVLNEDIRDIIPKPPGKIFAIFKKEIKSHIYKKLSYKKKDILLTRSILNESILSKIDISLLDEDIIS